MGGFPELSRKVQRVQRKTFNNVILPLRVPGTTGGRRWESEDEFVAGYFHVGGSGLVLNIN